MDRMDPYTAYHVATLRMAERHQEAARERMASSSRTPAGPDEQERSIWRRWTLRRLVSRIAVATCAL
jgi:hypothetical protein